jgi:hypothetical protein
MNTLTDDPDLGFAGQSCEVVSVHKCGRQR